MICPKCKADALSVVDSRPVAKNQVRRRRVCQRCGYKFTTYEITAKDKAKYEYYERQFKQSQPGRDE